MYRRYLYIHASGEMNNLPCLSSSSFKSNLYAASQNL